MSWLPEFVRGPRGRILIGSVAGLVVAGVLIGLLVAWLSTSVLNAVGLDTDETAPRPVTTSQPTEPSSTPERSDTTSATPSAPPTSKKDPTLTATPSQVGAYDEITLTGRFPGLAPGTDLQIQRRVGSGAWELFPVSLSSGAGGRFSTFVQTGQTGENEFRIKVPTSGLTTPIAAVLVG